jgi:hypothetical protein
MPSYDIETHAAAGVLSGSMRNLQMPNAGCDDELDNQAHRNVVPLGVFNPIWRPPS